ncbi:MAG TPA: hypothetical protein VFW47_02580 [Phenylobacterium sp.]|nr:hypothetical protein [Phenylobacterium sp.]
MTLYVRLAIVLIGLALAGTSTLASAAAPDVRVSPYTVRCIADDEIDPKDRTEVSSAAKSFVEEVFAGDVTTAYGRFSDFGRRDLSPAGFAAASKAIHDLGPYSGLRVSKTYLTKMKGRGPGTLCGDLSRPEERVEVSLSEAPTQAFVIFNANGVNNELAITVWLDSGKDGWRINGLNLTPCTLADRTSADLLAAARAQRAAGHAFNARLLYEAAASMAQRGPYLRPAMVSIVRAEANRRDGPPELSGAPPFNWTLDGQDTRIAQVGPMAIEGELMLVIQEAPGSRAFDKDEISRRQQGLILDFLKRHPEVVDTFSWINWRSVQPDGVAGFATVYDLKKGFL